MILSLKSGLNNINEKKKYWKPQYTGCSLRNKIYFSSLKFFFLKNRSGTFMHIWKKIFKDKSLCLKKPHTLGAWNRQFSSKGGGISCSYSFLGICEVILKGRDLIFFVEPHISLYFTDIKYFSFNFDNLEPAPGGPAPE